MNSGSSRPERVTFLMPVKNGMPYLPATLASIEAQTYRNFELLVWDNGSTDDTVAELRRWVPGRIPGRIAVGTPLSLGKSLARLVDLAATEMCARIDADDLCHPTRLERQVGFLEMHASVGIVGTQIEFIDENGAHLPGAWTQPDEDAEIRWQLRWQCPFSHPTVLFRRSVVLEAGNYADCIPEDADLWFRMGRVTEMANLPDVLVKYRRVSTGFTATVMESRGYRSPLPLFDEVARRNAGQLFDGLPADDALSFRSKLVPGSDLDVTLVDLYTLRRVAGNTARAVGKPPSYFRGTQLYASQRRDIIRRWVRRGRLGGALLKLRRWVRENR